ncbi:MAG: methyl-accepting chemotaxis protein, partial [Chloroflexi bacterium]|nr:methyl-accepting chemotaxis protein [Chloroflexota bacterium]
METITTKPKDDKLLKAQIRARQTQFARTICQYTAQLIPFFMILGIVLWLFFRQYPQVLVYALLLIVPLTGARLYPLFERRNRARVGTFLFLISLLSFVDTTTIILPELMPAIAISYVMIILMSNSVLDDRDSRWMTGLCVLIFGADVIVVDVVTLTWFTPLDQTLQLTINVLVGVSTLLASSIIIYSITRGQEKYFYRSQLAQREIAQHVADEMDQRERLQTIVQEYVDYMSKAAQGNLSTRLTLDADTGTAAQDPLIALGHNLNATTASLQRMIIQTRDASTELSSAATEILSATTQQAAGASEQSAAIAQTTITVDEVKTIAEQLVARA